MIEQDYLKIPVVKLVADMVKVPSETGKESAVAGLLRDYMLMNGLAAGLYKNNVHATIGSLSPDAKTLLFVSHIDTVAVTPSWTVDPYIPTITNGRLYGLGSNDAAGCFSGMVHALVDAKNSGLSDELAKNNQAITVVGAAEEETAGYGGFRDFVLFIPNIQAAIVGEPTSLRIGNSQRGREVIEMITHGISAHSSRPYEGVNAAEKLAYEMHKALSWHRGLVAAHSDTPTFEPTMFEAGQKTNQLPSKAIAVFDSRTTAQFGGVFMLEELNGNKIYPDTEIKGRPQNSVDAKHTPDSSPLITATKSVLIKAGIDPVVYAFPAASDWAFVPEGVPGIVFGPGDSNQSHQADESVDLEQVIKAQTLYLGIMQSFPPLMKELEVGQ